MNAESRQRVRHYLRTHRVATLATMGGGGPWAAAVFYASDGDTLYFLSSPNSRHCRNLEEDPRAAATIQGDYDDWPKIKGVQMEGMVSRLGGGDEKRARRRYGKKFPLIGKIESAPAPIVAALTRVRWYRLMPTRLYFIDNSVSFGHREEITPVP